MGRVQVYSSRVGDTVWKRFGWPDLNPAAALEQEILYVDWENAPVGPVQLSDFRTAWQDSNVSSQTNLARSVIGNDPTLGHYFSQTFAASSGNGFTSYIDGPFAAYPNLLDATIEFWVRITGGLGWGCKITGLGGINGSATGPTAYTGGKAFDGNGWSGRHMNLQPGSNEVPSGNFSVYLYHPGMSDNYGDNFLFNAGLVLNQWTKVKTRYRMNTPGVADGLMQQWWNGTQVRNSNDVIYRTLPDVFINYIYNDLFWGGSDNDAWAPSVPSTIDITNIRITTPIAA